MPTATSRLQIIIDVLTGKGAKDVQTLDQRLVKLAATLGVAALAGKALKAGLDFAKESTLLAARVETLGVVTAQLGENVGKSETEIRAIEKSIQDLGITTQASRQAVAQMIQAELDLADATGIARLAQDTAVIANENSSQSFQALTQIIATGNTLMARRRGLLVDFEGAYKRLAIELDTTVEKLTQQEKVQARTNEVMAQGVNIAGAYEAAMDTAGKKLSSFARHSEELKLAFGELFQEGFGEGIDLATNLTDVLADVLKVNNLLTDAYEKGNISRADAIKLKLEILTTDKTLADAVDVLIEKEKSYTEVKYVLEDAIKKAKKEGVEWGDIVVGLQFGALDLKDATILLNERLSENEKAVKLSEDGMRQYADAMTTADKTTEEYTFNVEALTRATEILGEFAGSIGDEMERLDQKTWGAAEAARALEAHMWSVAGATRELDGSFANNATMAGNMLDEWEWAMAGGAELESQLREIGSMLVEPDIKRDLLEEAFVTAIKLQVALGELTTFEGADAIALQLEISDLEATKLILAGPDGIQDDLETLDDMISEAEVKIDDKASDPIDTLFNRGEAWEKSTFTATFRINYPDGRGGGDGGGGGGRDKNLKPIPKQHGGPVSAGQPYWVGEVEPELFVPNQSGQIIPSGQVAGKTVNIYQTNYITPTDTMSALTVQTMLEQENLSALAESA